VAEVSEPPQWLRVGIVGRPHGLDGSFHVLEATPEALSLGAHLRVRGHDRCVERRAGTDPRPIIRLENCLNREGAEALRGEELLMARERAPELEADEWWAQDLEGCTVCDGERMVGSVTRLRALPSCEVLEVARDGGELLIPLVADAVRSVDLQRRLIDVDLRFLGEEE
jgi:16S rRNA processing protein RimM